jgi:hypothetical protein
VKTFSDLFRYPGGDLPASAWQVLLGNPLVLDNAVGLPAGGLTQAIALTAQELDCLEQVVRCAFQIKSGTVTPYVGVMLRAELSGAGSPQAILRCYLVTVAGDGTLTVYSYLQGAGVVTLGTGLVIIDTDEVHNLIVKVRDTTRGPAEIVVYLDDELSPALQLSDRRADKPSGKYVGFDIMDTTGNQNPLISEFYAAVLRSSVIKNPMPQPTLKTFGDLKYETAFRLDRGGDSQFSAAMLGEFINHAQNEVCAFEGYWKWLDRVMCFVTNSDMQDVELPAYVQMVYDLTEKTNGRQLGRCNLQDINRTDPTRARTGVPTAYAERGRGDNGGLVLCLDRKCGGQYSMVLDFYAKPCPMVEDTDLPMVPPEYIEVLIWGALERAFQHSDDLKGFQMASNMKTRWLMLMRRANQRSTKGLLRMITANEQVRTAVVAGAGPVTRAQQLGY